MLRHFKATAAVLFTLTITETVLSTDDVRFRRTANHGRSEGNFFVHVKHQSCISQVKSPSRVQNNIITHAAKEVMTVSGPHNCNKTKIKLK